MTPKLSRIAPELPVSDLPEALEHYGTKLGFEVAAHPADDYAIVERDDVAIHLFRGHSPVGIHIFCSGLEELQAEMERRGARISQRIERKPWGTRDFRIHDPWGNELKFTEPLGD